MGNTSKSTTTEEIFTEDRMADTLLNETHFIPVDNFVTQVMTYEKYYLSHHIVAKNTAEKFGYADAIAMYVYLSFFNQHDLSWDENQRQTAREKVVLQIEADMKKPHLQNYYEQLIQELDITLDDYIDRYALLYTEYDELSTQFLTGELDIAYDFTEMNTYFDSYLEKMGMTRLGFDQLRIKMETNQPIVTPQPEMPFKLIRGQEDETHVYPIGLNNEERYYFTNIPDEFSLSERYGEILTDVKEKVVKDELTRQSAKAYLQALQHYTSEDPKLLALAKELEAFFEIYVTTVEMDGYYTISGSAA